MLSSIYIENIALIKSLSIDFSAGFSAFTGETGAGKSIIVDAMSLIAGEKAMRDWIRTGETHATVEALFSNLHEMTLERCRALGVEPDEDGCIFVQRKIQLDGHSSSRVNARTVPQSVLRELASFLINIHGQHSNQELLDREKHVEILDRFGQLEPFRNAYYNAYQAFSAARKNEKALQYNEEEKNRRIEVLTREIQEITAAKPRQGEDDELRQEKKRIQNREKLLNGVRIIYESLYAGDAGTSAVERIDEAIAAFRGLTGVVADSEALVERLEGFRYELVDIAQQQKELVGGLEEDPAQALNRIEERLDEIERLKRRYGGSVPDILRYQAKAEQELETLKNANILLKHAKDQMRKMASALKEAGESLSKAREETALCFEKKVEQELRYLDMGNVRFQIHIARADRYKPSGNDEIEFFLQTNVGEQPHPLCKTASGGELSRIMLAVKSVMADKDGVETLIYDEIDTGISGKTSRKIGLKLKESANFAQVLCVTHSAQIASLSQTHFLVTKREAGGRTVTEVTRLEGEERVTEIARIIAGIDITESARKAAAELIENSRQ